MITLLLLFQLKHFVVDFLLQTKYQWSNKGILGHPGGILHSGLHALATGILLFWLCSKILSVEMISLICGLEFFIHYFIDYSKVFVNNKLCLKPENPFFWHLLGFDQLLHQLTYLGIAFYIFI